MLTVFEKIPDLFVELYNEQFEMWAREYQSRGAYAAIVFNRVPGQAVILDLEGKPIWKGCWLHAEIDRSVPALPKVVIKPRTEHDEEMIRRHCKDMMPHILH